MIAVTTAVIIIAITVVLIILVKIALIIVVIVGMMPIIMAAVQLSVHCRTAMQRTSGTRQDVKTAMDTSINICKYLTMFVNMHCASRARLPCPARSARRVGQMATMIFFERQSDHLDNEVFVHFIFT